MPFPFLTTNIEPHLPPLVEGKGVYVVDEAGKVYLDLSSQTLNLAFGHSYEPVIEAVVAQLNRLSFASSRFASRPFLQLSRRLVDLAPSGLTAVNLKLCDGSDAVETALKTARVFTHRETVLCVRNSWHGETSATLGLSYFARVPSLTTECEAVFSEDDSLASLASLIEENSDAAAVIVDPIGVSNGLFELLTIGRDLTRIRDLCSARGMLLIFDEVQTFGGFLGEELFAATLFGVTPDLLCLGKALGAGLPLAATLFREDLRAILQYNEAEFTNGGQPPACVAALAAIDAYERHRDVILDNANGFAVAIAKSLGAVEAVIVRQLGFFATITRREDRFRSEWVDYVYNRAIENGLILRKTNRGRSLLVKPPVWITPGISRDACSRLTNFVLAAEESLRQPSVYLSELSSRYPTRIRKALRRSDNLEYLQELLTRLDGAFKVSERSADEQERLCRRLGEAGIRTSIAYASREGADEVEYIFVEGEPLDKHLNTLGDEDAAEINSLVLQHQRFVTIAHDVGVVVGDRWPGNAIVSQGRVTLIDFAIGYSGNFKDLCCCEELFSLFQCLSFLRTASVRDDLAGRLCPAISKRHGRRAGAIWEKLSDFYTNPRKPSTPTSLPQERYVVTADSFDRFL